MNQLPELGLKIQSAAVAVSMAKVESYYTDEIANEGTLQKCPCQMVILPQGQAGKVSETWICSIFKQMHQVRSLGLAKPISLEGVGH